MIETVAWSANVLFVAGAWLVARRRRAGVLVLCGANLGYCGVAAALGTPALFCLSAVLVGINVVGFRSWKEVGHAERRAAG